PSRPRHSARRYRCPHRYSLGARPRTKPPERPIDGPKSRPGRCIPRHLLRVRRGSNKMQRRRFRRALVAAFTTLILMTVAAYADTVPADGDAVTPGNQSLVVLPDATPGQVVTWPITFRLTCTGLSHVAPGT